MSGLVLAVLLNPDRQSDCQHLAERLALPVLSAEQVMADSGFEFFLSYRDGALKLLDRQSLKKGGLQVEIEPRPGEQHSWPAPRKNILAQAIGKKTRTVMDATTGWAQDSLALFRMGYQLRCLERSPVLHALIADGFKRLSEKDWVQRRALEMPELIYGDAITLLGDLPQVDCIYLDPMFPPKRKKSALTKKSMAVLRHILGDDLDRMQLFEAAMSAAGKRVVIKSPDYAEPLAKPDQSFRSKLLRYDVFLR
ncbi:class I SAM-dependent methyltransferase [methane-oxidizing endosymbiont of Gigantopelta aegis]|uniref:class I SAM-dependent methyltransferase n=1 Tax=methane-oxidizing endosymbiont of Gigantopelta aegis TaxID=2794938 RepID=UPI0018DECDDC|nr:class I SAM-dependent methyltransferase [methane-oxidizing endosymbiont of Gigantopelta aegis]